MSERVALPGERKGGPPEERPPWKNEKEATDTMISARWENGPLAFLYWPTKNGENREDSKQVRRERDNLAHNFAQGLTSRKVGKEPVSSGCRRR